MDVTIHYHYIRTTSVFLFSDQFCPFFSKFHTQEVELKVPTVLNDRNSSMIIGLLQRRHAIGRTSISEIYGCIVVLSLQLNGHLPDWNSIPEQNPILEQFWVFGGLQHALALCAFSLYCTMKFWFRIIRQCSKLLVLNRGKQF